MLLNMKLPRRLRTKVTELTHFKALLVFVFAVYGFLIPLWFAFHGNKFLGNNDQWSNMVITSTKVARSQMWSKHGYLHGKRNEMSLKKKKYLRSLNGSRMTKRPSQRHRKSTTLPKPLHRFDVWPRPPQSRQNTAYYLGRLLSMKWEHLCCQSINCLRKFPLFPRLPSKKKFVSKLRLSKKGRLYGQRIAGLIKPPESGAYAIYMKCLSTCEFWLSDNEYPLQSRLLKKIVRGIPVDHTLNMTRNESRSLVFKTSLQAGRVYFMDVLLTVYRFIKHPFEVSWKLPSSKRFVPLSKEFFTGFDRNPETFANVLKLYSHSPSVHLTPFLESIEESGDDDDDFTILGGKNLNLNYTFMDSKGHQVFVNSSLQNGNVISFPNSSKGSLSLKECSYRPSFLKNKTLKKYSGVWKTTFSSVIPGDKTGHMMCIGNRYPEDCQGNRIMSQDTASKVLTLYNEALRNSNLRNLAEKDVDKSHKTDITDGLEIHQLVSMQEKTDTKNGSLLLVDAILKNPRTNSTYYDSQYLYLNKNQSSLCLPRGYSINWKVTVNIILVAKRQTRWLRHFLANMEKVYVKTNDKNINIIIAKYGKDNEELMEEYKSNRLPSIRTVRHRGAFDKRRAIQSAVKKIKDQNSIIFLMDLHIVVPDTIIQLVRKHTIQGNMVFNPVLFRLSHCGSPASSRKPSRGFWETFGYGILGIYKSDWDNLGLRRTKKYKKGWGGEDWELLDRVLSTGLGVQRLRIPNFYHFHHSKKGMWN